MDKISLGIPIYNARTFIERTLLSALNQSYSDIEYLFIDDKGDSMDIVRNIVENHPRKESVRIIDQKYNQGIAAARNAILDNATGKYLFTMDCDDVISLDCIETLYNKMQEHPVDFVAASFVRCDVEGNEYPGCQYADTLIEGQGHPVAQYRYGEGKPLFVATWNKLYRLDFLKEYNIRCQNGHYNEDPWFTYQVIINARSCRLLPNCTLQYTCNPESVSGTAAFKGYSETIARQFVEIQQLKCAYICPLNAETFYRSLLIDIMSMSLYHAYRIEESHQLSSHLKKELQRTLLTVTFSPPVGGKCTMKYLMLRAYFCLPVSIKLWFVVWGRKLHIKDRMNKWMHFS